MNVAQTSTLRLLQPIWIMLSSKTKKGEGEKHWSVLTNFSDKLGELSNPLGGDTASN